MSRCPRCSTRSGWARRSRRRWRWWAGSAPRRSSPPAATWRSRSLAAAAALRVPVLLWEGNLIPGRSVRAIARLARVVAVSFAETCRRLPGRCHVTGTPIRNLASVDRLAARRHFEIPSDARAVLIFGGSQAVQRFDSAVEQALPELAARAIVVHVTGESAYGAALARREALPDELRERYRPYPFLREEMADALVAADLVVGRAGSSTLAEVTALGTPLVVVPYPHAAGHQAANARVVAEQGAALVIADEAFDGAALLDAAGHPGGPPAAPRDEQREPVAGPAGRRRGGRGAGPRARRPAPSPVRRRGRGDQPGLGGVTAIAGTCGRWGGRRDRGARRRGVRRGAPADGRGEAPPRHRDPAPRGGQDLARRAAGALHHHAGRRPGGPVRGGAQPLRAARARPLRPHARPAAVPAGPRLGPRDLSDAAWAAW